MTFVGRMGKISGRRVRGVDHGSYRFNGQFRAASYGRPVCKESTMQPAVHPFVDGELENVPIFLLIGYSAKRSTCPNGRLQQIDGFHFVT